MRYTYLCKKTLDVYEVNHSIKNDAFKTVGELLAHVKNDETDADLELVESSHENGHPDSLMDEAEELDRVVTGGQGFILKGLGWPSMDSKHLRYTGKRKKQMEQLREDRAKRVSSGRSVADVAIQAGLQGVTDSVVTNKKWSGLSKDQQSIARNNGFRPSSEYSS